MAQQNNLFTLFTSAELLESLQQHTQCLQLTSEVQLSSDEGRKEAFVVSYPCRKKGTVCFIDSLENK